jgi:hypothetical protein
VSERRSSGWGAVWWPSRGTDTAKASRGAQRLWRTGALQRVDLQTGTTQTPTRLRSLPRKHLAKTPGAVSGTRILRPDRVMSSSKNIGVRVGSLIPISKPMLSSLISAQPFDPSLRSRR